MHVIPTAGCNPFSVFFVWCLFWLWFWFVCLLFLLCCFCLVVFGLFSCLFSCWDSFWTAYWSTTGTFVAFYKWTALHENTIQHLPRLNVCNDLAEAMKALDGKNQQEVVTHLPQTVLPVAPATMNTPAPVRPCSSSSLKWLTWGTHGCHK